MQKCKEYIYLLLDKVMSRTTWLQPIWMQLFKIPLCPNVVVSKRSIHKHSNICIKYLYM